MSGTIQGVSADFCFQVHDAALGDDRLFSDGLRAHPLERRSAMDLDHLRGRRRLHGPVPEDRFPSGDHGRPLSRQFHRLFRRRSAIRLQVLLTMPRGTCSGPLAILQQPPPRGMDSGHGKGAGF